ncbi:hypothetical protein [Nonomuraea aridisoli]|nr:hypothetical protein [Nonomuraea aridisoli]
MARAEGQQDEARRATDQAYQRLAGHEALLIETTTAAVAEQQRLQGVGALLAEWQADLEAKGDSWRPAFRAAVEMCVDQLAAALAVPIRNDSEPSGTVRIDSERLGTGRDEPERQGGEDAAETAGARQ